MKNIDRIEMTNNRRALHAMPEISMAEKETAAFLKGKLLEYGLVVEEGVSGTYGLIGSLKINDGAAVAYRADMDALPVVESTRLPFASQNPGVMHACGHDGHMAMALALAKVLSENREDLKKNVIFLFQPAEEGQGGAKRMIDSGFLDRYRVECILGAHVSPDLDEGCIGSAPGVIMSSIGVFSIEIQGVTSHAATPQKGSDALLAACQLVVALKSAVSSLVDPLSGTILSIGRIESGTADNLVPARSVLLGSIRSLSRNDFFRLKDALVQISNGVAEGFHCHAAVTFAEEYPEVNNDSDLFRLLRETAVCDFVEMKPQLISEDFSFYQEKVPGLFLFVGIRNEKEGCTYPLHSDQFMLREEALVCGVDTFLRLLKGLGVV